jgi:NTP pyrophosphatase (non-canonical NTP hydrolase)
MKNEELYAEAIKLWGENLQLIMAIEEMAELTKAITKYIRGKPDYHLKYITEEIADVEIMLEQLKYIFQNSNMVERIKQEKLLKLKLMIEK